MLIREVRAANADGDALVLALHRQLTVVAGLHPDEQIELADILAAIVYGRTEDLGGSVEVHGEELSAQAWGQRVGEDLDDLDVFVRRSDIGHGANHPGVGVELTEPELVTAARGAVARAEKVLQAAERDLELARRRAEDARAAAAAVGPAPAVAVIEHETDGDPALEGLRAALVEAGAALATAEAQVEEGGKAKAQAVARAADLEASRDAAATTSAATDAEHALACEAEEKAAEALRSAELGVSARRDDLAAAVQELAALPAVPDENPEPSEAEVAREAELLAAAEAAMAEAEVAAAQAEDAAQAVEAARRELERAAEASGDPAAASSEELAALDRRSQELEDELARARAEESLFAGFAETQRPAEREPATTGRSGRAARRSEGRTAEPPGDATLIEVESEARRATARAAELRAAAEALQERAAAVDTRDHHEDRQAAASARRAELEQRIAAAGLPVDTTPVVAAAAELRHLPSARELDDARRLLEEVDALVAARGAIPVRTAPTWLVDAARTALEEARMELARAEEMARPMRVSAEEAAEFERAHAAVLEAEARADRRFGGPMARRRLDKAVAEERELLLKFGLPSYTAFLFRTMPISSDSAGARHLDEARRAMADAEAVWEELHQAEYPDELAALEQQEASVLAQATAVLGPERMTHADVSSPAATLRSVRSLLVEATAADGDVGVASRRLIEAIETAFGPDAEIASLGPVDLLAVADDRVASNQAIAVQRGELAMELELVLADLEGIDRNTQSLDDAKRPDAAAVAEAEAAAADAERRAEDARQLLVETAIAAGIAPAAAALAADAAVLDEGTVGDDAPTSTVRGGSAATDVVDFPPGAPVLVDWEAQAVAEVERSQREIATLGAEIVALDARRSVLRLGPDGAAAAPVDPNRIARLSRQLEAAEADLTAARRAADDAAARAAAAVQMLAPVETSSQEHLPSGDDGPSQAELAQARVSALELAVGEADDAASLARAAVGERAADRAHAEARRAAAAAALAEAEQARAEADRNVEQERERAATAAVERDGHRTTVDRLRAEVSAAERHASDRAAAARSAAESAAKEAAERADEWQRRYDEAVAAESGASAAETQATRQVAAARVALEEARAALVDTEAAAAGNADALRDALLEEFLAGRLATARSNGHFGPVPLIFLDPFSAADLAPVAPLLAAAVGDVQMIYLTAEDEVLRWAEGLGADRALVLRFGDPVVAQG